MDDLMVLCTALGHGTPIWRLLAHEHRPCARATSRMVCRRAGWNTTRRCPASRGAVADGLLDMDPAHVASISSATTAGANCGRPCPSRSDGEDGQRTSGLKLARDWGASLLRHGAGAVGDSGQGALRDHRAARTNAPAENIWRAGRGAEIADFAHRPASSVTIRQWGGSGFVEVDLRPGKREVASSSNSGSGNSAEDAVLPAAAL